MSAKTANMLPVATILLAVLLSVQPQIPGYAAASPAFTLMAVYYWTIYRPDLLPPPALFILGTFQDLISGGIPGETALLLLIAYAVALRYRRHFTNRPFPFVWAGFTLLTCGATLLLWILHSLLVGELLEFRSSAFRAVLTIAVFPVASLLFGRAQRAAMRAG